MTLGSEWLGPLASQMKKAVENGAAAGEVELTIRQLLGNFGYSRRGSWINGVIRNALEEHRLITDPDFEFGWIDSIVAIRLDPDVPDAPESQAAADPTYRIRSLEAANKEPRSVKPDQPLQAATTIMLLNDYSQLPVMTTERELHGVISWESIGARTSLGQACEHVRDCMSPAQELLDTTPLIDAIRTIAAHGYVLVRRKDKIITGIVTASDLSLQLRQLAEPFLLIGEIEGYLRHVVHGRFTVEQLQASSASEGKSSIAGSGDLTIGDYHALLRNEKNWDRLGLRVDRAAFAEHLDQVRQIRNATMHFNPDGPSDEELAKLRGMARFFESLARTYEV